MTLKDHYAHDYINRVVLLLKWYVIGGFTIARNFGLVLKCVVLLCG